MTTQSYYSKRIGTSNISGQLYETKLLTLLLLRVLNDKEIDEFCLGSNVADIGDFDDAVLWCKFRAEEKPKIFFLQAKHKDDVEKTSLNVLGLKKRKGDFSLCKYLDSYIRIRQQFNKTSENKVFNYFFEDVDCDFVIYTPSKTSDEKKFLEQTSLEIDNLIHSNVAGKIFKFDYDKNDLDDLKKYLLQTHIELLAKTLVEYIFSGSAYNPVMSDRLIETYHVVLAERVFHISDKVDNGYRDCKFRESFLDTDNNLLCKFRETFYSQMLEKYRKKSKPGKEEIVDFVKAILEDKTADTISKLIGTVLRYDNENKLLEFIDKTIAEELTEWAFELQKVEVPKEMVKAATVIATKEKLQSLSFKLPSTFGNFSFSVRKGERRLHYLTKIFIELFKNAEVTRDYRIIKIDDTMVGCNRILKHGDLKINGGIGGLVGNLLILDEVTKMLKLNDNEESLPENARKLFNMLNDAISKDVTLNCFRFKISVNGFPKIFFDCDDNDEELIKDFLSRLRFFANQDKEDVIEEVLKKEIDKIYCSPNKQKKFDFRIKSEAIFLKVHDNVQKWWKLQGNLVPYLTKSYDYFNEAKDCIIDSPLLTILNFLYTNKFKNNNIFNDSAIAILGLDSILSQSSEHILHIVTNYITLSSMKLYQYFKDLNDYVFLDFNYILKGAYYEDVIAELRKTKLRGVIIVLDQLDNLIDICSKLENIKKTKMKIIIISDEYLSKNIQEGFPEIYIKLFDVENNLTDFNCESQKKFLENGKVVFQGVDVNLDTIINDRSKHLIQGQILSKLIEGDKIIVGKPLTDINNEKVTNYYVNRNLARYVKIGEISSTGFFKESSLKKKLKKKGVTVVNDIEMYEETLEGTDDILLISQEEDAFNMLCTMYEGRNIHWFKYNVSGFIHDIGVVWKKSKNILLKLLPYVTWIRDPSVHLFSGMRKRFDYEFSFEPKTIMDIEDKVVIVAAEPGMGKSTFLTHLSVKTKERHPSSWIMRINLSEYLSEFKKWQDSNITINIAEVIRFLYRVVYYQAYNENLGHISENSKQIMNTILQCITIDNDDITFKNDCNKEMKELGLLEIQFFNHFYNLGKMIVLCDGFDKIIPDYTDKVMNLLEVLADSKIQKLWITTRTCNVFYEFGHKLNTFPFYLEPFSSHDQKKFLERYLNIKYDLEDQKMNQHKILANSGVQNIPRECGKTIETIQTFSCLLNPGTRQFISIPLYLYIMAEFFHKEFDEMSDMDKHKLTYYWLEPLEFNKRLNLVTFFKRFVILIFGYMLISKHNISTFTSEAVLRIISSTTEGLDEFIDNHKKLAGFKTILTNCSELRNCQYPELLSEECRAVVHELKQKLMFGKETTIVEDMTYDRPIFVHNTFADYFGVEFISDMLKTNSIINCKWDFIINIFLRDSGLQSARRFFDCKLALDHELMDLCCNNKHRRVIFKLMLKQKHQKYSSLRNAFDEGNANIADFLVKSVDGNLNYSNLDDFIELITTGSVIYYAVSDCYKGVFDNIIKLIKTVNDEKLPNVITNDKSFSPFSSQLTRNDVEILLKNIEISDNEKEIIIGQILSQLNLR